MVNKPLIRPYFFGGGTLRGGWLTSHYPLPTQQPFFVEKKSSSVPWPQRHRPSAEVTLGHHPHPSNQPSLVRHVKGQQASWQQISFHVNIFINSQDPTNGSIFTYYIWLIFMVSAGKYTIHKSYGKWFLHHPEQYFASNKNQQVDWHGMTTKRYTPKN